VPKPNPEPKKMPSFENHCAESIQHFGKPFPEVHRWLDEFAFSAEYGMRHRKKRHHSAGIAEAQKLFGEEAAAVARRHILSDLRLEGWKETDPFPRNEDHYVKMGLF
jgi:hypothetical protein